jgi:Ca2+-binding EF-hand superfamily protein
MFTWIFVYLYKNEYFNARLHDSSLHIPRLQKYTGSLSLTSLSSEPPSSSAAPQDVDGTGVMKYSKFLAATIEAHGVISKERLAEAFNRIVVRLQGGTKAMVVRLTHVCVHFFTGLCDDSGYITVDNLASILGPDVPKSYLASIIDEADHVVRDKQISYEEFLALWDERKDVKRT